MERFISEYMTTHSSARDDVPWEAVKEHISASFLHIDEASALRDELEKTNQSAYEPEAGYNRRLREVADPAYPTADRNDDQNRILIRAYTGDYAVLNWPDTKTPPPILQGTVTPDILQKLLKSQEQIVTKLEKIPTSEPAYGPA